jgi:GNAT superfamily N-acetyltransferase
MTADAELIRLELENQIAVARAFLVPDDPALAHKYGTSLDDVAGLVCSRCAAWDYQLFNRAIGAGLLGPLAPDGIDQIVRHYTAHGRPACVEVYDGSTPITVLEALVKAGFADSGHGYESHALARDTPLEISIPGVDVRRCEPVEHRRFAELVRDGFGFGDGGIVGEFVADLTVSGLDALGPNGGAFIASFEGEDAGTGELVLTELMAGCYSGTVAERFRGRGIQKALIAARVREGLTRGKRIFISQTDPDSPSGHNLRDLGFRTLYRARWYLRPLE